MRDITECEFTELVQYIKRYYGINLLQKKNLVVGRLRNYLIQEGFRSFSEYLNYILTDPTGAEGMVLVDKITTNHTYFMREPKHFYFFEKEVMPWLARTESGARDLRIWSAGCSSGEEPYTLALIIDSIFGIEKCSWDTKILATDISTGVLEQAKAGVYSNSQLATLPMEWRKKYFKQMGNENSIITEKIRNEVVFRKFNLISEIFPFRKKFHVIFCRNVMIYFDTETRRALVNRFYDHTEQGGYLFIGHSESLNRQDTPYKYVAPAIYRKE